MDNIPVSGRNGSDMSKEAIANVQSIGEKMRLARNVVIQCYRIQANTIRHDKPKIHLHEIHNIMRFTCATEENIRMADMILELPKTFNDYMKERYQTEGGPFCFLLRSIRGMILELYTKSMQVATLDRLLQGLVKKRWMMLRHDKLRVKHDVYRHGYGWKRLPGTDRSIMVERSEQSLKRMEYLSRMKSYREAGRSIVYVDARFYYYQLVVSPQHGLLHMGFHCLKKDDENFHETWVIKVLNKVLPPNSVIVLKEDRTYERKLPTPLTSKTEMVDWLKERNIPHDPTLHRSDLYILIRKFKHLSDTDNSLYKVLKNFGHDVITRPKELKNIDFLEVMWPGDPRIRCKTDTIVKLREKTIDEWQKVENIIKSREEKMYQEDMMLEAVVDKLLTLAKYGQLSEADLDECDEELPQDDYYSSIILD